LFVLDAEEGKNAASEEEEETRFVQKVQRNPFKSEPF